jgi:hypothetical protein
LISADQALIGLFFDKLIIDDTIAAKDLNMLATFLVMLKLFSQITRDTKTPIRSTFLDISCQFVALIYILTNKLSFSILFFLQTGNDNLVVKSAIFI